MAEWLNPAEPASAITSQPPFVRYAATSPEPRFALGEDEGPVLPHRGRGTMRSMVEGGRHPADDGPDPSR